jgi:hypothetical protein
MESSLDITVALPSEPISESISEKIAAKIREIPEVYFAYLPEIFIPDQMEEPEPVLVLVSSVNGSEMEAITQRLNEEIAGILPDDLRMNILILRPDHELVAPTISTGCLVEINDHKIFEKYHNL